MDFSCGIYLQMAFCFETYVQFSFSINKMTRLPFGWTKLVLITIHKKHTTITASHSAVHLIILLTNGAVLVRSLVAMNSLIAKLRWSFKVCRLLLSYLINFIDEVINWQPSTNEFSVFSGNVDKTTICQLVLDDVKVKQFKDAIENSYWFEFFMGMFYFLRSFISLTKAQW